MSDTSTTYRTEFARQMAKRGITREQMADAIGRSLASVKKYRSGERVPSEDDRVLGRIAVVMGLVPRKGASRGELEKAERQVLRWIRKKL